MPTAGRDETYDAVAAAWENTGYSTHINGPDTSTPVLLADSGDGSGLMFSMPVEGGPVGFSASSACFAIDDD